MALQKMDDSNTTISNASADNLIDAHLNDMIEYLIENKNVFFKSQQRNESDLTDQQKRNIALEIFNNNKSIFLSRFGKSLKKDHLQYFERFVDDENDGYDLNFYIQNLKRYFSRQKRKTDIKNRRYGALNKMISDDNYFTEKEMMKRNPLLYEQLVGQYMTEEEKKKRDNIDTQNITFVNVLLEGIDRDQIRQKKKQQLLEESGMDKVKKVEEDEEEDSSGIEEEDTDEEHETERKLKTACGKTESDNLNNKDESFDMNRLDVDTLEEKDRLKMDALKKGISEIESFKRVSNPSKIGKSNRESNKKKMRGFKKELEKKDSRMDLSRNVTDLSKVFHLEGTPKNDVSTPSTSKQNNSKIMVSKININITNISNEIISNQEEPIEVDVNVTADDLTDYPKTTKRSSRSRKNSLENAVSQASQWGEFNGSKEESQFRNWMRSPSPQQDVFITATERALLKEEFVSIMYQNFIDGKDTEFDYSSVDNNEEYDNIEIRNCDAEEEYFNSESPEAVPVDEQMDEENPEGMNGMRMNVNNVDVDKMEDESEDELDVYMRQLNQHHSLRNTNRF